MAKAKYDITKIPKWAQKKIKKLEQEIEYLQGLKKLHAYLVQHQDKHWFSMEITEELRLFILSKNQATPIAWVKKGDIIFFGRKW